MSVQNDIADALHLIFCKGDHDVELTDLNNNLLPRHCVYHLAKSMSEPGDYKDWVIWQDRSRDFIRECEKIELDPISALQRLIFAGPEIFDVVDIIRKKLRLRREK